MCIRDSPKGALQIFPRFSLKTLFCELLCGSETNSYQLATTVKSGTHHKVKNEKNEQCELKPRAGWGGVFLYY